MRLYIQTSKLLRKFNLPAKIDGSMLFSFKLEENGLTNSINLDAINGHWVLRSNGNINIVGNNGTELSEVVLSDYMCVPVTISGMKEIVFIFALPSVENYQVVYDVKGMSQITIGKGEQNNIRYLHNLMLDQHASISYSKDHWFVIPSEEKEKCFLFVNDQRVTTPTPLFTGDILFMNGLRIIWMHSFFIIPMDSRLYSVKDLNAIGMNSFTNNTAYTSVSEIDNNITLYNDNDYFSHTPRIRSILEEEEVSIEPPPAINREENELPFLLSFGSSFMMIGMLTINAFNLYDGLASGTRDLKELLPQIIMISLMFIGSLMIPMITRIWTKKLYKSKIKKHLEKYNQYLAEKEVLIDAKKKKQEQILIENYGDLSSILLSLQKKNRNLWNRVLRDDDFLEIRVGIGDRPSALAINAPKEKFSLEDDELYDKVVEMGKKYEKLNNVPITVNFRKQIITSLIMETDRANEFIDNVMLQLLALHSPLDLKIVVFTDELHSYQWNYLKYTNHNWSDDRQTRFFSTNQEESKTICQILGSEYQDRKERRSAKETENADIYLGKVDSYALYDHYYLIITDNYTSIRNFKFINDLLENENNLGFSLVVLDENMKNIPIECKKFLVINDTESGMFNEKVSEEETIRFKPTYADNIDMRQVCQIVSNIPIQGKDAESQLPTTLSFLDMFNVGKIEQLNIHNRWKSSDPMSTLATCIGVHASGDDFILDLHEKHDGPHGLIAGSTGSGKSEFIITYILSMAINYDPREVQFVLIDYKGGGLAGAFENRDKGVAIPHIAGTITNLDSAEMNRALVSISSELKRRQRQFNSVKEKLGESTMDIYKYQRLYREGLVDEPISHLFIISDEFAELKSQQPDFMSELISTARIGRALGVHLILATQKPAGVVNDQIWSNSRFKVCLKVQNRSDSMEMLKRPEAASLKEAGRFYLQVGYDEYFDVGQSGWSGDKYVPTDRIVKKVDTSISFVNHSGNIIKQSMEIQKKDDAVDYGEQLTNIVRYLISMSEKDHFVPKKLWLPPLEKTIIYDDLIKKYSSSLPEVNSLSAKVTVGEFDAPVRQKQGLMVLDLLTDGNILIYGVSGSGKENAIFTILYDLCLHFSPEKLNIYIGDFGSESLRCMRTLPQVGDVFVTDDNQKLVNFVKMINKELDRRKKEYADYGGSFIEYCKNSGKQDSLIVSVLNNYEVFLETYPKLFDAFTSLFRDGAKFGMIFIVSTTQPSSVRAKIAQNFPNKLCLKMPNNTDYRDLLSSPRGMVPVDTFGRGIYSVDSGEALEFQTANICDISNRIAFIKAFSDTLKQKYPSMKARKIPILPDIAYVEDVLFELKGLHCVPIGIEKNSLEVYVYNFLEQKINLIAAKSIKNHIYFIYALIRQMLTLSNVKIHVIDALSIYRGKYENVDLCNESFENAFVNMYQNVNNDASLKETHVYYIIGISEFKKKVSKYNKSFEELFARVSKCKNNTFLFFDDSNSYKFVQIEDWFKNNINNTFGIWLGEEISSQIALSVMSLQLEDSKNLFPCIGYPIYQGNHMVVKYVVDGVDKKDEQ